MPPHHHEDNDFSAPPEVHEFAALLFDMDGTIIDSTAAIVKHWQQIGEEIGVPGDEILKTSHGRRSIDVLALLAPQRATWDYVCAAEGRIPIAYGDDATEIPGSRALLEQLEDAKVPWAIVTSGTRPLVTGWLGRMRLALPGNLVSAEEVSRGKPDPECYRVGARRLGFDDGGGDGDGDGGGGGGRRRGGEILVLEDAPSGIRAGKAAGYRVVALATTHAVQELRLSGADWIVRDMRSVRFLGKDAETGRVSIEIRDALLMAA
ncbi:probable glycerol-3-phosphate phosphatase (glycerol-1-phosphatase) [Lecanosticta acicola]|uniref:Probable glycerol-3-phosphate phosphatase (Glycerol-1-phosphatase) n=1 Tax=Lecanosticta acicola TaxID=111012 RepID=A0AAI9EBT0_9PEZI|nr:probable glycerol-3-phosphate phosphatase (glycerol-1-phosphatase) [Lecanosticta acicola]